MQQKIKEQEQEVQIVERKQQIEIAEQEIQRKERELDSKVRHQRCSKNTISHNISLLVVVFRSRNRPRPRSSGLRRWPRRRGRG